MHLCQENPDLQLEGTAQGELVIVPPQVDRPELAKRHAACGRVLRDTPLTTAPAPDRDRATHAQRLRIGHPDQTPCDRRGY